MAISQRRQREIEDMKSRILDAASELFVSEGYEQTTLRKIAKKIEYNPATIYNYFKSKEEIFFALQHRAFTKFYAELESINSPELSAITRLKLLGQKYIEFGLKYPEYYKLMFILKKPMEAAERLDPEWKIGEKSFELLKDIIRECMKDGSIRLTEVKSGAYLIWSTVHGLVSLVLMDRCQMIQDTNLDFLVREAFTSFEKIYKI